MFPGLRAEISQLLSPDFTNLQVLHEALDQPGGLVALADFLSGRLQEDQMMIAHELRQFRQHSSRDMQRERRMLSLRVVRPRLEEPLVDAQALQNTFVGLLKKEALPVRQVRKTRLNQSLTLEVGNPVWALELSQYLIAAELPVVRMIQESEDHQKSWARVFGSRRAKTLRNRATTWKRYYVWLLLNRCRHWPKNMSDLIDFMEGRIQDGCGATAPQNLMGALALLETVGRVEESAKLSRDRTVLDFVRNMQMQLQTKQVPHRDALHAHI
eukprot:s873_g32.t1